MQNKHQVHNLIILDESGSMDTIKSLIISGFNELVQSVKGIEAQFPEQEHLISMVSFNALNNNILHFVDPVNKLDTINDKSYNPASMTPLYDAMGFSISKLKQYLDGKENYSVLVTVLTDGEENASKEYTGAAIKNLVDELKQQNWTFTYIGADHDIEKMAATMNIHNTMSFNKNDKDIKRMFINESESRIKFRGIRRFK
jgi:Mg-chelatase subunit ChlD